MNRIRLARGLLIAGLVIVFGVFGLWKFIQPVYWIGWIAPWLEGLMGFSTATWLRIFGSIEILLALLLLIPQRRVRQIATVLMTLHFAAILTQTGWTDVFVRDVGLLLSSMALLVLL